MTTSVDSRVACRDWTAASDVLTDCCAVHDSRLSFIKIQILLQPAVSTAFLARLHTLMRFHVERTSGAEDGINSRLGSCYGHDDTPAAADRYRASRGLVQFSRVRRSSRQHVGSHQTDDLHDPPNSLPRRAAPTVSMLAF